MMHQLCGKDNRLERLCPRPQARPAVGLLIRAELDPFSLPSTACETTTLLRRASTLYAPLSKLTAACRHALHAAAADRVARRDRSEAALKVERRVKSPHTQIRAPAASAQAPAGLLQGPGWSCRLPAVKV